MHLNPRAARNEYVVSTIALVPRNMTALNVLNLHQFFRFRSRICVRLKFPILRSP